MLSRLTALSTISIIALTACATQQENPYYKYSSKYKGNTTTVTQAGSVIQTAPVSYQASNYGTTQQASYSRVTQDCLRKEKNRELLGAGIGGTVGAIAGKKLIGGTKGTVIGAGLGGAAGYGVGDISVNCNPEPVPVQQFSTQSQQTYSSAPTYSHQAYTNAPTVPASYPAPVVAESSVSPTDTEFKSISESGTPGYQVLQAQTAEASYSQPSYSAQEVSYDYRANTIDASVATVVIPSETRLLQHGNHGAHIVQQGDTVYSLSRKLCVGITDIQSLNNLDANYGINIGDTLRLPASNC